jgi:hypothetical protein
MMKLSCRNLRRNRSWVLRFRNSVVPEVSVSERVWEPISRSTAFCAGNNAIETTMWQEYEWNGCRVFELSTPTCSNWQICQFYVAQYKSYNS